MDVNRYHLFHDIKPPAKLILISPNFSQLEQLKKKTNFLLVQNMFFLSFGPMKSLFSFSTSQTEKNSWKKIGENKIGVRWFDVTNKIYVHKSLVNKCLECRLLQNWPGFEMWGQQFNFTLSYWNNGLGREQRMDNVYGIFLRVGA
jgi:hypothetical protein